MIRQILHSIVAQPQVYDAVQRAAGMPVIQQRLRARLGHLDGASVLDLGAGTGLYLPAFPPSAHYIWLDMDADKLRGFRARTGASYPALLGDGTGIGLRDAGVDYATSFLVVHHLDDAQLPAFVDELARVARKGIVILDPLAATAWPSALLWRYDRGSYPRTAEQLTTAFSRRFKVEHTEIFTVYHSYLLMVASPR
jgi:ubiquinone/menaquinone biosynthesis C-methylase UbiE